MERIAKDFDTELVAVLNNNDDDSKYIKKLRNDYTDSNHSKYLLGLDEFDSYTSFGADKCGCSNVPEFLEKLNIDIRDLKIELLKFPEGMNTKYEKIISGFPLYTIYSRDKKLTMTVSSKGCIPHEDETKGYFHYFGISGETQTVIDSYSVYEEYCNQDEICWGCRVYA